MRVPLAWLRAYCNPALDTAEIVERLDMTGTEVLRVERGGLAALERFVVGKVVEAGRHPDADRLTVCTVDDGSEAPRTIVCGAPNVRAGQTVALALPGAITADGRELGEARLRGVVSSGMILAEDEVGLGEDHGGIMVLPDELEAGRPLAEVLPIGEEVIELEITPNRPDCLAVYGVARELHAATGASLVENPSATDATASGEGTAEDHVAIEISDPEICRRFTGRVFEGVAIGPSPLWLKARLTAGGQRPISNVVDITNYVMLTLGQPMHAFDLDEVRGARIEVRRAREGERMTTLDGEERSFDPTMAVVCDAEGPTGIAGIMGGQVSEVSEGTTRVLMEAATWVGPNILQSSSRLGLRSEAGARFEKGLHPELAMAGQRLAAKLMVELCGARMVPGTIDVAPDPPEPRVVRLRLERVRRLVGISIPVTDAVRALERLGFGVAEEEPGVLAVGVPPTRDGDVQREADLIEEVSRIHGVERLPATLPARRHAVGRLTPEARLRRRLEDGLRDRGLLEVVAWSFTAPAALDRLGLGEEPTLRVANPLSEDASVMRPLLLPGLLDAAARNAAHGRPDLALFESAHVYRPAALRPGVADEPNGALAARERHHLAVLLTRAAPRTWRSAAAPADFHAAKGLLEGLLEPLRLEWGVEPLGRPFLHPGRSARILAGGTEIGWIGELHPTVLAAWEAPPAAAFELDADALADLVPSAPAAFGDVASFPAAIQDIAVVVPEAVSFEAVEAAVRAGGGPLLRSTALFDVFRGEQVGEGAKSLALRLEFGAPDRTLTDEEVAGLRAGIEAALDGVGGRLRA